MPVLVLCALPFHLRPPSTIATAYLDGKARTELLLPAAAALSPTKLFSARHGTAGRPAQVSKKNCEDLKKNCEAPDVRTAGPLCNLRTTLSLALTPGTCDSENCCVRKVGRVASANWHWTLMADAAGRPSLQRPPRAL